MPGIIAIEIVRLATEELGVSIARGVSIATTLLSADPPVSTTRTPSGIEIVFPIHELERRLRERLVEAVEAAPSLPRGRPRIR